MKVVSAEIRRLRVPFRMEFKHALAARRMTESVILKLTLDNGMIVTPLLDGPERALTRRLALHAVQEYTT